MSRHSNPISQQKLKSHRQKILSFLSSQKSTHRFLPKIVFSPAKKTILKILFLVLISFSVYVFWGLPNPTRLASHPAPVSTKLLDRNGKLIYEIFTDQRRTPIQLSSLPDHVWQSTLAAEDKNFYQHSGFSVRGISRAIVNIFFRQKLQGGSTITQQLVKKALLTDDRTIRRKIRELLLSLVVEVRYSKDQILEFYLNQIPYGGTAYGIESASQTYFGKSSIDLTIAESAMLAGLPQAPSYYSPFGSHPEEAKIRQQYVLTQMLENGFLSPEEYQTALDQELVYARPATLEAPHFALWVKDLLLEKYGLQVVEQEGLVVTTSLDLDLQKFAQATVASEVAKLTREKVGNGAVLVTHPKTGQILSMVGSKDYFATEDDGNVNVVLAKRQPGSSIKPLNYAIALDHGLITASTLLSDKPTCFTQPGQPAYCPQNYDNQFHGPTQVRFALGNSFNIPAVKALVLNGLTDFIASSSAFGISTWKNPDNYGPSLTLGGGEVTMYDLSTAYSVLANTGQKVDLNPLIQVKKSTGQVLDSVNLHEISSTEADELPPYSPVTIDGKYYLPGNPPNTRVISPGTAFIISHILYDNSARSATFGSSSYLNIKGHPEVSVKTGTTNDLRDNWTVGYNPDLLVAVWVGNNDNSEMSRVASGVTGASPIWNKIMTFALSDFPQHWPSQPAEVVGVNVCNLSGLRVPENADPATCSPRFEYFLKNHQPGVDAGSRRDIPINKLTGAPASERQLIDIPGDIEYQNHTVIFDALGTMLCLDCPGGFGPADNIRLDQNGKAVK